MEAPAAPLAYLITFRSYGTWLHGDERGSVDRFHNYYGTPQLPHDEDWQRQDERRFNQPAVIFNPEQRRVVEHAIRETCVFRKWLLRTINIRTNHVHVVVSIESRAPERALNAFKANATRQLRERGHWNHPFSPWSDGGSKRYLWTEGGIERAIDYVINGQGGPIPQLD